MFDVSFAERLCCRAKCLQTVLCDQGIGVWQSVYLILSMVGQRAVNALVVFVYCNLVDLIKLLGADYLVVMFATVSLCGLWDLFFFCCKMIVDVADINNGSLVVFLHTVNGLGFVWVLLFSVICIIPSVLSFRLRVLVSRAREHSCDLQIDIRETTT